MSARDDAPVPNPSERPWSTPDATHVQAAVDRLVEAFDPLRIVVFGSYARGETTPHSDLDLLVVLPEVEHKRDAAVAMRRVLSDVPVSIDVHPTTPEEIERRGWIKGTLLEAALSEGRDVYRKAQKDHA
jgi:predicted nucleotidyltransferase